MESWTSQQSDLIWFDLIWFDLIWFDEGLHDNYINTEFNEIIGLNILLQDFKHNSLSPTKLYSELEERLEGRLRL